MFSYHVYVEHKRSALNKGACYTVHLRGGKKATPERKLLEGNMFKCMHCSSLARFSIAQGDKAVAYSDLQSGT